MVVRIKFGVAPPPHCGFYKILFDSFEKRALSPDHDPPICATTGPSGRRDGIQPVISMIRLSQATVLHAYTPRNPLSLITRTSAAQQTLDGDVLEMIQDDFTVRAHCTTLKTEKRTISLVGMPSTFLC